MTAATDPDPVAHSAATNLQDTYDRLGRLLSGPAAERAVELAWAAFRRLPAGQLAALDPDEAAALVLEALAFVEPAPPEPLRVAVRPADAGPAVLQVHEHDGPFVLSTVTEELQRLDLAPRSLMHPVFGVDRDPDGRLRSVQPARGAPARETYLHVALAAPLDEAGCAEVDANIRRVLADARAATRDFPAMKERIRALAEDTEALTGSSARVDVAEVAAFLRWIADEHMVILGCREYRLLDGTGGRCVQAVPSSGLGVLADVSSSSFADPVALADLPPPVRASLESDAGLLTVSRTNHAATVHRQARMVSVSVQRRDEHGRSTGIVRVVGLFAQRAFAEPSSTIPLLRAKLAAVLESEDVVEHSYDERAIRSLFDSFPKQELLEIDAGELCHTLLSLLEVTRRGEVRLILRPDISGRTVSALVTVPRDRFSAELRQGIQALLVRRLDAVGADYQLSLTESDEPLLHFVLHLDPEVGAVGGPPPADGAAGGPPPADGTAARHDPDSGDRPAPATRPLPDERALEEEIRRLTRTWGDELTDALAVARGADEAQAVAATWCRAFPAAYVQSTSVPTAVADIAELEQLDGPDDARMRLVPGPDDGDGLLRFRLCKGGPRVELSGFLPILESLGLTVVEELPFRLGPTPHHPEAHIHDYGVRSASGLDRLVDRARVAAAAAALAARRAEVDSLNRLVAVAGLSWEQVAVLRAYRRYRRQVGTTFTESYTNQALIDHPAIAAGLYAYFAARFDPDADPDAAADARVAVLTALDAVERLDQDRILRSFLGLIDATLRTNRWRDRPFLSLKFDSARVPGMRKPVPHVEIFVYSPDVEGVHLRGGPVARGGLRWSDRQDDFRTEILGLMKAQMTKNAVIVPTGSKGGFVLKRPPVDPTALRAAVETGYRTFIRGLLDLTDNVAGAAVVPPDRVVRLDGDDPYLVVAADRGTATFSDVANAISAEYGFWLGDAFASGGSQGYDHKAMGITARGAWVAVQRHFRELDTDPQTDPISVVGVGDMSGDVFGNGLLRSRSVRLVAAFDHRHVFLDPDPDPARSYAERQRLFALPRSSWADYDPELISPGGGVWPRTAKSVPLSPAVRAVLRVDDEALPPPDLITAMLRAPVDLLFFGGIGTFVKAADQSHAEVGDRANDAVRVDAAVLGARVVGEGGNLAMTQQGRIAYARRGGKCNTDAVDNVAGVDTSDHEVNLKILLGAAIADGALSADERDTLLHDLTDDVAERVLRDCYLQTWAISQEERQAPGGLGAYEQFMADLETRGRLDRDVEVLPSSAEMQRRQAAQAGLTRPELAVLLGYAKMDLYERLMAADVPDQPYLVTLLRDYFPTAVADRFPRQIAEHRLRRELVATALANDVVNRMGITWAVGTAADIGCAVADLVSAYWVAREVAGADARWREIEDLDDVADPGLQLELKAEIDRLVDSYARFYAASGRCSDIGAAVTADRPALQELAAADLGTPAQRAARRARTQRLVGLGLDESLAAACARLPDLVGVPAIADIARRSGRPVRECADVHSRLADALPLDELSAGLNAYEPHGRWERWQHRGLADDLRRLHAAATWQAVEAPAHDGEVGAIVAGYLSRRERPLRRARELARGLHGPAGSDLDAIAVVVRALSEVVSGQAP